MAVSALMNMDLPDVSTTLGPAWATKLYNALYSVVDSHDHTSGNGQLVPSAGIDIDADLDFGNNDATSLRTVRFRTQTAALAAASDLRCLYAVGSELYYNDGNGTAVAITLNGAVTGASGTIAGLPSGTASAAFATATFTFRSATNVAALMDVGPVYIRDTAVSAKYIALKSPVSLAADYDITLPAALPNATKFMRMTTAGVLSADVAPDAASIEVASGVLQVKALGITGAMIYPTTIAKTKLEALGQASVAIVSSSTSSLTAVNIGSSRTITTVGRPVMIFVVSGAAAGSWGSWRVATSAAGAFYAEMYIDVTGTATATIGATWLGGTAALTGGSAAVYYPPGALCHFYAPALGTYTFQIKGLVNAATTTLSWGDLGFVVYEL